MTRDNITITRAATGGDLNAVRALMGEYLEWHHARYAQFQELIEKYFDHAGFWEEVENLPGDYAPPQGRLLIARQGADPLGCVALRDLGDGIAEMRRMFVTQRAQGAGVGTLLARHVMMEAKELGYQTMRLDTGWQQREAVQMYERLGFRHIQPYYKAPVALQDSLVFMETSLHS